jgi:deoxyribonuclease-4
MQIGAHLSPAGGIDKAVDRAVAIGAESLQVFTQNPRAWRHTNHDPESFERFREKYAAAGLGGALCHATYLCNMAAKDEVTYERSVATLVNTTQVACAIGAHVVFHVGSHLGAGLDAGLEKIVPALEQALELCSDDTWLLMENSAGAGGTIGRSIEELATIHERLGAPPHLGICLDTCHLYVSGIDVTDPAVLDACLDEVDATIGLSKLRALHVNDSAAPFGSNRDRHANVLEGELGEEMGVFLANPRLQGLPAVLEVAGPDGRGPDAAEIQKTKDLRERWLSKRD